MSDAINSVLSQIRTLQTRINTTAAVDTQTEVPSAGFSDTLQSALGKVNSSQMQAGELRKAYESGEANVDLVRVMLASQQAQIGFRATVEVRNRLVRAYQDVMNMSI